MPRPRLVRPLKQSVETMLIDAVVGSDASISISAPIRAPYAYERSLRGFIILSY